MIRIPKTALCVIFVLLIGLCFFTMTIIRNCFAYNYQVIFDSDLMFYIAFGISGIICFLLGIFFVSFHQPWTLYNFIQRIGTEHLANYAELQIMELKHKNGWDLNYEIVQKKNNDKTEKVKK